MFRLALTSLGLKAELALLFNQS